MDINKSSDRAQLLNFYQLKTLKPQSYAKDTIVSFLDKDYSEEQASAIPKAIVNKLLSDNATKDSSNEASNASSRASTDFRDPLGFSDNIKELLLDMDVIEDTRDPELQKYMIDSKSFNPRLFLSRIHADKSIEELRRGVEYLDRDIESKKPELQKYITSNFEQILSIKNDFDNVFSEYSASGLNTNVMTLEGELAMTNSRASQQLTPIVLYDAEEKRIKNALKEIRLNKEFLDLPKRINQYVKNDDFDTVVQEYRMGEIMYAEVKVKFPKSSYYPKAWAKIQEIIKAYQNSMFAKLNAIYLESISPNFQNQINQRNTNFVNLVKRIIILGCDRSPIREFIKTQYNRGLENLNNGLSVIHYDRLINARKGIINAYELDQSNEGSLGQPERLSNTTMNKIFSIMSKQSFRPEQFDDLYNEIDLPLVIELWGFITSYVTDVTVNVVEKKIFKFESIFKFFMHDFESLLDTKTQKEKHMLLVITEEDKAEMKEFFYKIITKICGRLNYIFTCTRADLDHAISLGSEYGPNAVFPPKSDKNHNDIDSFGFIPPHSNSISGIYYIVDLHSKIHKAFAEMQLRTHIFHSDNLQDALQSIPIGINKDMIIGSLCLLNEDMKSLPLMENWVTSEVNEGCTKFPEFVLSYFQIFLKKLHELRAYDDTELTSTIFSMLERSLFTLVESLVQVVEQSCQYDQNRSDFYHFSAIANMKLLRKATVPTILKTFGDHFDYTSYAAKDLTVYKELKSYEDMFFEQCVTPYLMAIKDIVRDSIMMLSENSKDLSAKIQAQDFIPVSGYIMRVFSFINAVKSKSQKWNASKTQVLEIELTLLNQFIKKVVESLTSKFTKEAATQISLDLGLIKVVIDKFNSMFQNAIDAKKLDAANSTFSRGIDVKLLQKNLSQNITVNMVLIKCVLEL